MGVNVKNVFQISTHDLKESVAKFRYDKYKKDEVVDTDDLVEHLRDKYLILKIRPHSFDDARLVYTDCDGVTDMTIDMDLFDVDYPDESRVTESGIERATDNFYEDLESVLTERMEELLHDEA